MSKPLDNYLRNHRRRASLSQEEVAYLLGSKTGAKVSRYERLSRKPTLDGALTCAAVLGAPVEQLFAGVFRRVEDEAIGRAQVLADDLGKRKLDHLTQRKLETLWAITCGWGTWGPQNEV